MDQTRILLKLILDEVNLGDIKLDSFQDRLCLQKKVYLVQTAGLELGYRYNWYLRGPYCPNLTENAYLLKEEIENDEDDADSYILNKKAQQCVKTAQDIWKLPEGIEVTEAKWVELLASIHYLKSIAYWPTEPTKELVIERLLIAKPAFKGKSVLVDAAWERLEEFGLLKKKSLAS